MEDQYDREYLSAKRLSERPEKNMEQCRKLTRTFEKKSMGKWVLR
jgi:hypothetical protein